MPTQSEIEVVTDVFVSFLQHNASRLATGARLREEMHSQMEKGIRPEGYRADWVRNSAMAVITELAKLALEFNEARPLDKISVSDLLDVLNTASKHLKKYEDDPE